MKQQIRLTESELHRVIRESVQKLIREYMPDNVGAGAKRGILQGKLGPWNAAQKIMKRDRWNQDQMNDFQRGFESTGQLEDDTNLEEYTDSEKMRIYGRPSYDEDEFDDFNEQPTNNLVANESRQYKVNESQLHQIIKESVIRILNKIK